MYHFLNQSFMRFMIRRICSVSFSGNSLKPSGRLSVKNTYALNCTGRVQKITASPVCVFLLYTNWGSVIIIPAITKDAGNLQYRRLWD